MYWLLTIFKKQKQNHLSCITEVDIVQGMGQSFLQSFSYHLMILVQELEIFLFMRFHIPSSQHEHEAQWHQVSEYSQMIFRLGLGSF